MNPELVRVVVITELVTLTSAASYLHHRYRGGLPRPLVVVGRCVAVVLAAMIVAVALNLASHGPITPGLYVVAGGALLPSATLAVTAVRDYRTARRPSPGRRP